jgi:hypothetical protein
MNEQLRERIQRRLEALSDERGYQVLDFVEFLESKYAARAAPTGILASISDGIEDTMRAAKVPITAIRTTTGLVDSAAKVMRGVAAAAGSVVDEAVKVASPSSSKPPRAPAAKTPPPDPERPPA